MRIDSQGIDIRVNRTNNNCKSCGEELSLLSWSAVSADRIRVCVNKTCPIRNQPQGFFETERRSKVNG